MLYWWYMAIRLFHNGLDAWRAGLQEALERQLRALQLDPALFPILESDPDPVPGRCLVLYFADGPAMVAPGDAAIASLKRYLAGGTPVIPVVDTVVGAETKLPEVLCPLNAFPLNAGSYDALVDEVLTHVWLMRTSRKVFISYKRIDSQAIAHALRNKFTEKGFEVFLDDVSIAPGKDFQRELHWWLNDADFVLLLASPNFATSRWVMEEIQAATISSIGLLAVIWPELARSDPSQEVLATLMDDQLFPLEPHDLRSTGGESAESLLTDATTARLLARLATVRARLVNVRLKNLVLSLKGDLTKQGFTFTELDRLGDFEVQQPNVPSRSFVRVLPFRPTVETIDDLRADLASLASPPERAFLYYQEVNATDRRLAALRWLLAPTRTGQIPANYGLRPLGGQSTLL